MTRGNRVFAKPQSLIKQTLDNQESLAIRDLFLHSLFARIALNDNTTTEFSTTYDKNINEIELNVPDNLTEIFNQITGLKRGEKFKTFINWLIGSQTINEGIITKQSLYNIDITSQTIVFSDIYNNADATVTTRIVIKNAASDAVYVFKFFINNVEVLPSSTISVTGGSGIIITQSKGVFVENGDLITVAISANSSNTDVDVETILSY